MKNKTIKILGIGAAILFVLIAFAPSITARSKGDILAEIQDLKDRIQREKVWIESLNDGMTAGPPGLHCLMTIWMIEEAENKIKEMEARIQMLEALIIANEKGYYC